MANEHAVPIKMCSTDDSNWRYYNYDCNTKTTTFISPAGLVRGDRGKKYSERNLPRAAPPQRHGR